MPNDWDGLPDPKPCPFCGGSALVVLDRGAQPPLYFVHCHECTASGPLAVAEDDAVIRWNKRPA